MAEAEEVASSIDFGLLDKCKRLAIEPVEPNFLGAPLHE